MQKRVAFIKVAKIWGSCVLVRITSIFSFPTHVYAHFARQITKRLQKISMWLQNKNKLKHRTHYAIFQNRRICSDRSAIWLWCIMRLVHFALYINGLRSAFVGEYSLSGCFFMRSWFV